jgi:hypothetical protein
VSDEIFSIWLHGRVTFEFLITELVFWSRGSRAAKSIAFLGTPSWAGKFWFNF